VSFGHTSYQHSPSLLTQNPSYTLTPSIKQNPLRRTLITHAWARRSSMNGDKDGTIQALYQSNPLIHVVQPPY
jgi:hypothetical protein